MEIEYLYKCCDRDRRFESRKELGRHTSDVHTTAEETQPPSRKGIYQCTFCEESLISQRGQAQQASHQAFKANGNPGLPARNRGGHPAT